MKYEIHAENHENMKKYINKLRSEVSIKNKSTRKAEYRCLKDRSISCKL